jgi:hypothetical protein
MHKRLLIIIGFILMATCSVYSANKDHPAAPAKTKKPADQQAPFDRARAELEYRQLQTEIHLAETKAL